MRRLPAAGLLLALISALLVAPGPSSKVRAAAIPPHRKSNPGQINVVTINAAQARVLDKKSFGRLFELARALRLRPTAFDGGIDRAVAVPDVILMQEMRFSNLEIFKRLIKQRYPFMYEIAGAEDATAKIMINLDTVTPSSAAGTWDDACVGGKDVGGRTYQWLSLTENATGLPFTVATIHFSSQYGRLAPGQSDCLGKNISAMRAELKDVPGPMVIGGDFNKRPTTEVSECDSLEGSDALPWYAAMLAPDGEDVYIDAAKVARSRKGSISKEWTFERKTTVQGCNGGHIFKRSRLDYLFVRGALIGNAGVDDPGWAGKTPGTYHPRNYKYSDHRFVGARLILSSAPRGSRPVVEPGAEGLMSVWWEPVPDATGYVVYRANGLKPFDEFARIGTKSTSFEDRLASHGVKYRYSIAVLGATGQGRESVPAWGEADARGPKVVHVVPSRGATGISTRTDIEVRFDERVSSWGNQSIKLFRNGNKIAGSVEQIAPRVLQFSANSKLRKGTTYKVVVRPVADPLGNSGAKTSWTFTTSGRKR